MQVAVKGKGLAFGLGLCLLATSLTACGKGPVLGLDGQRGAVRIIVVANGQSPVSGATVTLKKDAQPLSAPMATDGSGIAEFPNVPYGDGYRAFVNAHGFQTGVSDSIKVIGNVEANVALSALHAAGTGMVVGSVKEMKGAPIAGAQVSVAGRTATTNTAGQFTFANVPAGRYPVAVNVAGTTLYQAPPQVEVASGDVAEVPTVFVRGAGTTIASVPAGRYLIATPGRVAEFDRNWQAAWRFTNVGMVAGAVRLPSGETAIADAGANKVIVVSPDGRVLFKYGGLFTRLKTPNWLAVDRMSGNLLITDTAGNQLIELAGKDVVWTSKGPWNQPRSATYTSKGTILVADTGNGAVAEIDRTGNVVWASRGTHLRRPVYAQRLPNGNTLITDAGYNRVIEVDPKGRYVWHYDGYTAAQPGMAGDGTTQAIGMFGVRALVRTMNGDVVNVPQGEEPGAEPEPGAPSNGDPGPGGPDPADPGTGAPVATPGAPPGALNSPRMAVRLSNGNTLIADTGNGRVLEVTSAGQIVWENAALGRAAVVEKIGETL